MNTLPLTIMALVIAVWSSSPPVVKAWNIPGHMLSGAIAYQILQRESPATILKIRSILENNPWYETRWKTQLEKQSDIDRDEMLFMLATRWADDIRTKDSSLSFYETRNQMQSASLVPFGRGLAIVRVGPIWRVCLTSQVNATCLIGKTMMVAEMSFRKLNALNLADKVARGVKYDNRQEIMDAA